jgi:hypothetical protein
MKLRLQFAGCLLALGISAVLATPSFAQRARFAQNHPPKPPKPERQQQRQERRQQQQQNAQKNDANRPPQENANRPPQQNPNRPPSAYTPPPAPKFNNLNPQEKQKVLEYNKRFQNMTPAQKQQMREAGENWRKLSPEQRNHIKNDVLPRWKQLPPERQRAIQQRLGVLKNMPESARNQHLNDPNFTRGMNEEDKTTLRDLSHLHVGGAPDPPNE